MTDAPVQPAVPGQQRRPRPCLSKAQMKVGPSVELVSVLEAAREFGMPADTLRRLLRTLRIPCLMISNAAFFNRIMLEVALFLVTFPCQGPDVSISTDGTSTLPPNWIKRSTYHEALTEYLQIARVRSSAMRQSIHALLSKLSDGKPRRRRAVKIPRSGVPDDAVRATRPAPPAGPHGE